MESTKMLYDQYRYEKNNATQEIQFDMVKRIEDYRRNVNLYNSLSSIRSDKSIPDTTTSIKRTWFTSLYCNT